jgi:hypothetical protein
MNDNRISDYSMFSGDGWPFEVSTPAATVPTVIAQYAGTADLYAAAWAMAQRDFELDRLFNAAFYYEI